MGAASMICDLVVGLQQFPMHGLLEGFKEERRIGREQGCDMF